MDQTQSPPSSLNPEQYPRIALLVEGYMGDWKTKPFQSTKLRLTSTTISYRKSLEIPSMNNSTKLNRHLGTLWIL
eukprot:scaffold7641_cov115-Cylindrotheca_fusiformis.AAC.3